MPITIENLTYTYSPKTSFAARALTDISLTIEDGEFFGIIGHTGSGKSTLVQHLNGLIRIQQGRINVDGIELAPKTKKFDYKKLRSTVGMVFQYPEYQLFESTVERDVAFGPKNLGLSKEETADRVREALELVGLNYEEIKDRSPFDISGGQKRRAALAGIIAMRPKILVLDEPTAGLDPRGKAEILSLVNDIKAKSAPTIIMVSHNMDEIAANCSRVALLSDGKLESLTTARELFCRNAGKLRTLGLEAPTPVRAAEELRALGIDFPEVFTREEFISAALLLK